MRYKEYSARDFANDSFFIRWVKKPNEESEWFWKSFIQENPLCIPEIEKARELISLLDFPTSDLSEGELKIMRNRLLMKLRADKEDDQALVQSPRFFEKGKHWWKLAAAIIIVPLVCAGLFFLDDRDDALAVLEGNKSGVETRVNPKGQKSVLFLSDGTKVWLNAASKISYGTEFSNQKTRDVYLEGEAFFEVASNASKPFIVHTSSIKIKVLGTSFNVKAYSEEKTVETTLVEGKVRIEQLSAARGKRIGDVELKPNQCAVFNKASKVIQIREVVADNYSSWKRDRLVFDEESIDNVILQMERWFNVKIHVENKGLLDCKLTATIEKESLEEVLKLIEASHHIQYKIEGREVFIEGTLCESDNNQY